MSIIEAKEPILSKRFKIKRNFLGKFGFFHKYSLEKINMIKMMLTKADVNKS